MKKLIVAMVAFPLVVLLYACVSRNPQLTETPAAVGTATRVALSTASAEVSLTPSPEVSEAVFIKGGVATLGRTEKEVEEDYQDCLAMAGRTNQAASICEPKDSVFGDRPLRTMWKVEAFRLDIYEAHDSNGYPLIVHYDEAVKACQEKGGRLPTEEQWEFAARGEEGRMWPWGNSPPTADKANIDTVGGYSDNRVQKVGQYEAGKTPEGVHDMVGNVWEWVEGGMRKGGSAGSYVVFTKPSHMTSDSQAGFRCAYDAPPNS
ncbi:hypothetical protein A2716_02705 [candidate division WWE3 bacterium RIFCSPHIGHO2_01_FULL_40_23]|uniref:Sulfatase-modifying factor enzyme-like domain-containing protein n=1 Tax=candidate division WWE3 bacterium RIFCSPLOWO2_01_FULL_41_18 TaxID=1802625 RepID=A0A1F4VFK1_UNCKA|nr:MAG: hypothetical protein A2716_02705 [candidate division WWE3 bacterium RIFCSPHIGHO2_01_FULL_40_23]OGC55895.1 MAG: hypothetical protein A3A78_02555 [candidate division WWE3 bacterium RIFCSPLOWO2_01_FULL_41_18]